MLLRFTDAPLISHTWLVLDIMAITGVLKCLFLSFLLDLLRYSEHVQYTEDERNRKQHPPLFFLAFDAHGHEIKATLYVYIYIYIYLTSLNSILYGFINSANITLSLSIPIA